MASDGGRGTLPEEGGLPGVSADSTRHPEGDAASGGEVCRASKAAREDVGSAESSSQPGDVLASEAFQASPGHASSSQGLPPSPSPKETASPDEIFPVRFVEWRGRRVGVALQNRNGPCPLLAVANALSLRGAVQLPTVSNKDAPAAASACDAFVRREGTPLLGREDLWVSTKQLLEMLADYLKRKLEASQRGGGSPDEKFAINEVRLSGMSDLLPSGRCWRVGKSFSGNCERKRDRRWSACVQGLESLPSLSKGLCLNVRFHAIDGFEPSASLSLFDVFGIRVVHGWRPGRTTACAALSADADSAEACGCAACFVESQSYNQLAERAAVYRHLVEEMSASEEGALLLELARTGELSQRQLEDILSQQQELEKSAGRQSPRQLLHSLSAGEVAQTLFVEGPVSASFLEGSSSQLTAQGLQELKAGRTLSSVSRRDCASFPPEEVLPLEVPAVLFRNNHFSVIVRRREEQDVDRQLQQLSLHPRPPQRRQDTAVFALCSDAAFLESAVIWERLEDVKGNNAFCGANFLPLRILNSTPPPPRAPAFSQTASAQGLESSPFSHQRRQNSEARLPPPTERRPPEAGQTLHLDSNNKDVRRSLVFESLSTS